MQEIAGESSASTAPEVLARLQKTHGYSETEIKMYLVCLNKNQRGLLRWYNTGELYQQPSISLDQMAEKGFTPRESLTAEELTEQKEALDYILQAVRDKMPEYLPLWNRIIRDYGGDSSELKEEEQQEFNHSLHALRQDRQLLARIYEVLAPHENGICP